MVAGVEFPREETRRSPQNSDVFAKALVLRLQPLHLRMLNRGHPVTGAIIDIGLQHPAAQRLVANTKLTRYGR